MVPATTSPIPRSLLRHAFPIAAIVFLAAPAAAAGDGITMGRITAQLFYKYSGKLSANILGRKPEFSGWNTVIGEGDAEEPADDLLVSVTLIGGGNEASLNEKLELWVTNAKGKEVGRRNFDYMLVPYKGSVSQPLWLKDVGCAGLLVFHAKFRGKEQKTQVRLDCGE